MKPIISDLVLTPESIPAYLSTKLFFGLSGPEYLMSVLRREHARNIAERNPEGLPLADPEYKDWWIDDEGNFRCQLKSEYADQ